MRPLHDIRILELAHGVAGPFCGMVLADLGADVVKVEPPDGGDGLRHSPPFSEGFSESFAALNRNKRSVALDLNTMAGQTAARALALSADVVIEAFRPGTLESLGLDHVSLLSEKPELIYCSITPFGQSGPRAEDDGFELTVQAVAGLMSITGDPESGPALCPVPVSHMTAGLYAASSIQAALLGVRRGTPGQFIDVSMLASVLGISALQTAEFFGTGKDPVKRGSAHAYGGPHQAFRGADGWFALAAGDDRHWNDVCHVVGRPDLFTDERFATAADREAKHNALQLLLEEKLVERPVAEWLAAFSERGVPCAPINTLSDALSDKQVVHLGLVQPVALPSGGATRTVVSPVVIGEDRPGISRPPPALGEHTREVLRALGIDPPETD